MPLSTYPFLGATFQTAETHLTVSTSNSCDWPWKIEWTGACYIDDPLINYGINVLYMDALLEAIRYVEVREGRENGFGIEKYSYQTMRRRFPMKIVVDDLYMDALKKMTMFSDKKLYNLKTGEIFEIDNVTISQPEDSDTESDYIVTLEFEVKKAIVQTTACDCGVYADAPFESDCGDQGLEPRSNDDVCAGFDAEITESDNVLTATPSGGPANPPTYKWYYEPGTGAYKLLSGSAQSVTMGGYGTYRVIVSKGACQVQKDFLNQDPCNGLLVRLSKSNAAITAEVAGCETPSYDWRFVDGAGTETPLTASTQTIVATQTGNYRLIVTCGTCSREAIIYVEVTQLPECAGVGISIAKSGDTLTASVTGCTSALAITWTKDLGNGSGPIPIATTGASVTVDGNGLYEATAICGTCSVQARYLEIDCNIPCNVSISIAKTGNTLTATPSGCPGSYEIKWYKNTGGGYGSAVAMGDSFTATGNGMYKATVTCGDCEASKETMIMDCSTCTTSVSLSIDTDVITATVTGCDGTPVYEWYINTGSGDQKLAEASNVLNTTVAGVYKVIVTCNECSDEAGIVYTGCESCTPVNPGLDATVNVC